MLGNESMAALSKLLAEAMEHQDAHKHVLESIIYAIAEREGGTLVLPFSILTKDRDKSCRTNGGLRIRISEDAETITVHTVTPAQVDALHESQHANQH